MLLIACVLFERARAMKQDGQPINLLPRYVHSRQKPLVEQQQQQLPTTRKEDFHCQFAGCTKICKSAGGLTLHVRRMHRVQNNWSSIKSNPRPCFWSKVNEPSILLATISCYNWLFVCVQVLQFRSLFVEERTASNFHFEDLFFAQAQLCKTSHFTSLCSSQSAVFALCLVSYYWTCHGEFSLHFSPLSPSKITLSLRSSKWPSLRHTLLILCNNNYYKNP